MVVFIKFESVARSISPSISLPVAPMISPRPTVRTEHPWMRTPEPADETRARAANSVFCSFLRFNGSEIVAVLHSSVAFGGRMMVTFGLPGVRSRRIRRSSAETRVPAWHARTDPTTRVLSCALDAASFSPLSAEFAARAILIYSCFVQSGLAFLPATKGTQHAPPEP